MIICEYCNAEHNGNYGSGRFCSSKCSRGFSTKNKRTEINEKVSNSMIGKTTGYVLKGTKHQTIMREKHKEYYLSIPFEKLKKEGKKSRILHEQNSKCNGCGLSEWRNAPLVLELEHKDGDTTNNERSNLECLCPNCHSQTTTWRGRNKSKFISDSVFVEYLKKHDNVHQALIAMGASPKGANYKKAWRIIEEYNLKNIIK